MDRLIIRLPKNLGCVPAEGIGWQEIADRLAAYEDTGLEPKDVEDLHGRLKESIGMATLWADRYYDLLAEKNGTTTQHIADLLQAESEGRLIVLPSDPYEMADVAQEILSRACRLQREAEATLGGDKK